VNVRLSHPVDWRRQAAAAFTERTALKVSAVLLALVLWFIVGAREPREDVATVRFAPQLDSNLALRDAPPHITAHVIGRPNEILKLGNTPLMIRRPIANDVPDTLVLPLRTSDVEVPEGVQVIVREVHPNSLTLRFEPTTSRRIPVRSAITVLAPAGGTAASIVVRLEPDSVTVLGPRQTVAQLRYIATAADSLAVDTLPHLVDLDTAGLGVSVRPLQVKAFLRRAGR
jgi:hypothetical protein